MLVPAISPDGKQLAYITKHCDTGSCKYSVIEQDVGGSTTRVVLEGATAGYGLEWSPDRRNLIFNGTLNNNPGSYVLSALGGTPHFLTAGPATFYAGGDSLLIAPPFHADSVYWLGVASLDGIVHDSIKLRGQGEGVGALVFHAWHWMDSHTRAAVSARTLAGDRPFRQSRRSRDQCLHVRWYRSARCSLAVESRRRSGRIDRAHRSRPAHGKTRCAPGHDGDGALHQLLDHGQWCRDGDG